MQQRVLDLVDFFAESKPATMDPLELDLVDLGHGHTALSDQHTRAGPDPFATQLARLNARRPCPRIRCHGDVCRALAGHRRRRENDVQVS